MALERRSKTHRIEILEDGQMQIQRLDYILDTDTGETVAEIGFHRGVVEPGQDVSKREARLIAVAEAVWTPDVIKAYQDAKTPKEGPVRSGR